MLINLFGIFSLILLTIPPWVPLWSVPRKSIFDPFSHDPLKWDEGLNTDVHSEYVLGSSIVPFHNMLRVCIMIPDFFNWSMNICFNCNDCFRRCFHGIEYFTVLILNKGGEEIVQRNFTPIHLHGINLSTNLPLYTLISWKGKSYKESDGASWKEVLWGGIQEPHSKGGD